MIRQLHGQDTTFLYLDAPNTHMGVTMLYFYDQSTAKGGKIRFKQILQQIDDRIGESPVFRRKLERLPFDLDYPYWVDDDYFDVEFHVRHVALPRPGDWRQFCIQVARFHARPLDLSRPPLGNVRHRRPGQHRRHAKVEFCHRHQAASCRYRRSHHDGNYLEPPRYDT